MERVYERCAGLDVHKQQVTVCVHVPDQAGVRSELRAEFATMTGDLLGLRDWLKGLGVTHVAMEATGVYWKPVYYLLEDDFELSTTEATQTLGDVLLESSLANAEQSAYLTSLSAASYAWALVLDGNTKSIEMF